MMAQDQPLSIGVLSRRVISECVRKWADGAKLTDVERRVVDEAIAYNRVDVIQQVFHDVEDANVG